MTASWDSVPGWAHPDSLCRGHAEVADCPCTRWRPTTRWDTLATTSLHQELYHQALPPASPGATGTWRAAQGLTTVQSGVAHSMPAWADEGLPLSPFFKTWSRQQGIPGLSWDSVPR